MSMSERARQTLRKPTTPSRLGASSPKPERRDEAEREPEADEPVNSVVNSHDSAPEPGPEPEPEAGPEPRDRPSPAPSPEPTTPNAPTGDEPAMSTHSPTATLARQRSEATSEPISTRGAQPRSRPRARAWTPSRCPSSGTSSTTSRRYPRCRWRISSPRRSWAAGTAAPASARPRHRANSGIRPTPPTTTWSSRRRWTCASRARWTR